MRSLLGYFAIHLDKGWDPAPGGSPSRPETPTVHQPLKRGRLEMLETFERASMAWPRDWDNLTSYGTFDQLSADDKQQASEQTHAFSERSLWLSGGDATETS